LLKTHYGRAFALQFRHCAPPERKMSKIRTSKSRGQGSPEVTGFYEPDTGSIQYVVSDPNSRKAAIIDPVWDFDPKNARTATRSADSILEHITQHKLSVEWVIDTHPHADHFTAAAYLTKKLSATQAIGDKVREIAGLWRDLYNQPQAFDPGMAFDRLFADGETFQLGSLSARVMLSPGHTLGSITVIVGDDAAFVHDTLMQPDSGTARADFPGGDARILYQSIQNILALSASTRLFVGHDYCEGGREPAWEAMVAEHKASNIHVKDGVSEAAFVKLRTERDKTLPLPDRMLHALQVNLRGGRLPEPEADGNSYLKIPANRF
jgi:glyoxylase-like metal-dependent hydrolase (beta-lactamase superfamily II)